MVRSTTDTHDVRTIKRTNVRVEVDGNGRLYVGLRQHTLLHQLLQLLSADVPLLRASLQGSPFDDAHLEAPALQGRGHEDAKRATADHHIEGWSGWEGGVHL